MNGDKDRESGTSYTTNSEESESSLWPNSNATSFFFHWGSAHSFESQFTIDENVLI